MPSQRVTIGPSHIEEARAAAASAAFKSADPLVFADVVERGLSLRVQGGAVSWVLKWDGKTRSLGRLGEVRTAKAARELAVQVRALLRDGGDPGGYLKARRAGKEHRTAVAQVASVKARADGKWTFADLARHYCDGHLSQARMTSRGVLKPPSARTADEARRYLTMPEAAGLQDRLLSELRPGDLEEVRNTCAEAGRKTASRQFVAYAKAALSYARRKQSRAAGLEEIRAWWLEVEKLDSTIPAPRGRHPTVSELARVLWVAETTRVMPGRESARRTSDIVLCALWWLALSAQRASAGLNLLQAHILSWPDGPEGWRVAFWPNVVMKGKRPHAIPIPPRMVLLLKRALAAGGEGSRYVFLAVRTTGDVTDLPMTRSAPALLLQRLRGRPAGSPTELALNAVDLIEGIPHFSPHDIRRTFATTCGDFAVRGDAVSAVLDHLTEYGGSTAPIVTADITRAAYDYSQRLELKRIAIEAWTNALFAACDAEWASHAPRFRMARVPGSPLPDHISWYQAMEADSRRRAAEEAHQLAENRRTPLSESLRTLAGSQDDHDDDDPWCDHRPD